jgi:UPF0755 protein
MTDDLSQPDNQINSTINTPKKKMGCFGKIFVLLCLILLIGVIALTLGYAYYLSESNRSLTEIRKDKFKNVTEKVDLGNVNLNIKKGMSVDEIGEYFFENGLIENPKFLKAYMLVNNSKNIQAGYYKVDISGKTLANLIDELQNGTFEQKLTFIEGWRIEEYADELNSEMGKDFAKGFTNSNDTMEGYMFPDTYIIEKEDTPEKLASWMRNTFNKKFTPEMENQAALKGLTKEEVVILASILEREMNIKAERPIVAGILMNRYKANWPLQADATVQYALGTEEDWWPVVKGVDVKNTNSPYNTYLNKGLPPGPICNPSLSSLEAVVNYQDNNYWFYMTGTDGVTRYAKTLEEHNENIAKYL